MTAWCCPRHTGSSWSPRSGRRHRWLWTPAGQCSPGGDRAWCAGSVGAWCGMVRAFRVPFRPLAARPCFVNSVNKTRPCSEGAETPTSAACLRTPQTGINALCLPACPHKRDLSLIHISEPTRLRRISYAVFCLKKKKKKKRNKKKKEKQKKNKKKQKKKKKKQ